MCGNKYLRGCSVCMCQLQLKSIVYQRCRDKANQWLIYIVKFWTHPQSNFLYFHAVFRKIWPNNRLTPPPSGFAPRSVKAWMHPCNHNTFSMWYLEAQCAPVYRLCTTEIQIEVRSDVFSLVLKHHEELLVEGEKVCASWRCFKLSQVWKFVMCLFHSVPDWKHHFGLPLVSILCNPCGVSSPQLIWFDGK